MWAACETEPRLTGQLRAPLTAWHHPRCPVEPAEFGLRVSSGPFQTPSTQKLGRVYPVKQCLKWETCKGSISLRCSEACYFKSAF